MLPAGFRGFEALGLDELGVSDLLILFLLLFHSVKLSLLKHHHACLLERLTYKHVKHGLDLFIEIEQIGVLIEYLRPLAVLFGWHLWLEQRHGGSIQIELSSHSLLSLRGLVSKHFYVFFGLDFVVHPPRDWLGGGDVAVGVDLAGAVGGAAEL